ncbi:MAG: hypothetical protein ACRCZI_01025 [Cetobacterium sp.]
MSRSYEPTARENLVDRLERSTAKLQARMRGHFADDRSICTSCRWATITRQASKNKRVIKCMQLGKIVPGDIIECSDYKTINELGLEQMAEMAVLIDVRGKVEGGYL